MPRAKKSLSQNFLIDKNICNKIINLTNLRDKTVLEIGPGYGILTDAILVNKPKKIFLIEKDYDLSKFLKEKYKNFNNIEIINEDILKFELKNFKNLIILSNLPYNLSTKIILYLFDYNKNILEMIFMLQKEVAIKFDYNLLGMNKYKFLTKIVSNFSRKFNVSPKVFKPEPKITSTVVKFSIYQNNIDLKKAYLFCKIIFKNIRKRIKNNLKIDIDEELINKRLNQLSINELLKIYNFF